jgi:hypothetical protein
VLGRSAPLPTAEQAARNHYFGSVPAPDSCTTQKASCSITSSARASGALLVSAVSDVMILQFLSGEDARCRGGLITCIGRARRLYQHDVHFPASHGLMLNTLAHDKHLARVERDRPIPQLDVERTLELELWYSLL